MPGSKVAHVRAGLQLKERHTNGTAPRDIHHLTLAFDLGSQIIAAPAPQRDPILGNRHDVLTTPALSSDDPPLDIGSDDTMDERGQPEVPVSSPIDWSFINGLNLGTPSAAEEMVSMQGSHSPEESAGTELRCYEHECNGRKFSTRSNLARHRVEKSSARPACKCPTCGAVLVAQRRGTSTASMGAATESGDTRMDGNGRTLESVIERTFN